MASKKRGTAVAAAAAEVPGPEPAPAKRARVTTEAPGPAGFLGRVKALPMEAARDQRVSWDEYFGGMALLAAARSPCERLHVGCVVVRDRRVLSMGYNGFFQGAPHQSIMAHGHEQATVHAEQNAIAHAARVGISLGGGCAYVHGGGSREMEHGSISVRGAGVPIRAPCAVGFRSHDLRVAVP